MPSAYEVVGLERAKQAKNPGEFVWESPWGDDASSEFLLDTRSNEIVFSPTNMQPEDATLGRDLAPLVVLLNKEAA